MSYYLVENAEIIKDTGKAILINAPEFDEPQWVPQSQVHDDSDIYQEGEEGDLAVKTWWAEKEGWI
jgi:hypothetical protein